MMIAEAQYGYRTSANAEKRDPGLPEPYPLHKMKGLPGEVRAGFRIRKGIQNNMGILYDVVSVPKEKAVKIVVETAAFACGGEGSANVRELSEILREEYAPAVDGRHAQAGQ